MGSVYRRTWKESIEFVSFFNMGENIMAYLYHHGNNTEERIIEDVGDNIKLPEQDVAISEGDGA